MFSHESYLISISQENLDFVYQLKHSAFLELLSKEIVPYVKEKKKQSGKSLSLTCFISYAWGDPHHELSNK